MIPLRHRSLLASVFALALAFALLSRAQAVPPHVVQPRAAELTPQDQAELERVQDYLDGIHTLESRFQQFSQDGGVASGTIYLQRPGKMRIVYDDPVPILIVADGRTVYYWDKELQQLSQIGVEDTPAWFLLRPQIRLTGDLTVTRFEHAPSALRISLVETNQPELGSLTLVLSERPLELRQWTVLDAQKKPITVTLENPHYGATLNPNLFFWTSQAQDRGSH
jgi:outer membrane lipoprotein-sorting protein